MLFSGSRFDSRQDLPGNAQLRKAAEGCIFTGIVFTHGLIAAQHPLLHQVFMVCTHQKKGAGPSPYQGFIPVIQSPFGVLIPLSQPLDKFFIGALIFFHEASPARPYSCMA